MYGTASSEKLSVSPSNKARRPKRPRGMLRAFAFATRRNRWLIILASFCQIVQGVTIPLTGLLFGIAINEMSGENVEEEMKSLSVFFGILAVVSFISGGLAAFIFEYVADLQLKDMKNSYLRAILGLEVGYFDFVDTGTLSADIEQTAYRFRDGMGQKFGMIAQCLSSFIGSYVIAFAYHWQLCLIMSTVVPLSAGALTLFSQLLQDWISEADEAYEGANAVAEEAIGSIRTISAFGLEEYFIDRFSDALKPVEKIEYRSAFWLPHPYAIAQAAPFISFAIGMLYAAFRVRDRMIETNGTDLTLGGVVITVLSCVHRASQSLGMMVPSVIAFARAAGSVRSVLTLCKTQSKINPYDDSGDTRGHLEGRIRFKDVRFSYPTRPDRPVYDRLNLEIKAGETVALVGASGCGKSTVVQLIQRFYDPSSGVIEIDGLSHKEFNLQWLRSRMALVAQEPRLFTDTIEANIRYGAVGFVTEDDIIDAAKAANAHDFIMKFPDGYQTNVGQGGSLLSGGQKQRIAIARAILRDPSILILDEATSALDTESEQIVQQALDKLVAMKKRTTLIIAHRLTTIQQANKIVVLDNPDGAGSRVIEVGSHEELMAVENGVYRALAEAQQIMTEGKPEEQAALQRRIDIGSAVETFARENSELREHITAEDQQAALLSRLLPTISKAGSKNLETLGSKLDVDKLGGVGSVVGIGGIGGVSSNKKGEKKKTIRRAFKEIVHFKKLCITGSIGAILAGTVFPIVAFVMASFTGIFYDWNIELSNEENEDHLMKYTKIYVIGLFVISVCTWIVVVMQWLGWGFAPDRMCQMMRRRVFNQFMYLNMEFHDNPNHTVGRLSSVLSADCNLLKGLIGYNTSLIIETLSTIITGVVLAFRGHPSLAAVCFVLYLTMVPCIYYQVQATVAVRTTLDQNDEHENKIITPEFILNECVTNLKTIAAYNLQSKYLQMYDEALSIELKRGKKNAYAMSIATAFVSSLLNAANAITFLYAAKLLAKSYKDDSLNNSDNNNLDLSSTLQVLFTMIVVGMRVAFLSSFVTDIRKSKAAAENVQFVLSQKPLLDVRDSDGIKSANIKGQLEFDDLYFRYPSRPENPILGGVKFNVQESTTVALVGASGSGKSTIVQLIERFYCLQPSPQMIIKIEQENIQLAEKSDSIRLSKLPTANDLYSGEIRLDGKPIQEYNLKFLRSQIGLVGQEPCLFDMTIKENILLGCIDRKQEIGDAEIINACKLANAHSFILEQPEGYETVVGKGGGRMSGGQKQRLAIARALIRDPKILLLDEATSALDPESEKIVQRTIDDLLSKNDKARTSIMIAHRLATVRNAHKIVVFAPRPQLGAVVIEEGNHEQLMHINDGAYRKLIEMSQMVQN